MPIVAVFKFPSEDVAKYHKVFEAGGAPILEGTIAQDGTRTTY